MRRKDFLRSGTLTALALATASATRAVAGQTAQAPEIVGPRLPHVGPKVRLAVIGTGLRGQSHVALLLRREDVDLVAICDIDDQMLASTKDKIAKSGKKMPQVYTGSPYAWQDLLKQQQLDGVIIATPWEWHKDMVIGSLDAGLKYVATEVILGLTLQDHWDVVKAAEHHNANVMMLENVCYRRDVMAVLNMVQQGLFGELIHLQGGYQHNLRGIKFNDGKPDGGIGCEFGDKAFSEARWRTAHS